MTQEFAVVVDRIREVAGDGRGRLLVTALPSGRRWRPAPVGARVEITSPGVPPRTGVIVGGPDHVGVGRVGFVLEGAEPAEVPAGSVITVVRGGRGHGHAAHGRFAAVVLHVSKMGTSEHGRVLVAAYYESGRLPGGGTTVMVLAPDRPPRAAHVASGAATDTPPPCLGFALEGVTTDDVPVGARIVADIGPA